jgi:hypothetical protein
MKNGNSINSTVIVILCLGEKLEILQHNQRLFNRLMDISTESGPYSQSKGKFQSL